MKTLEEKQIHLRDNHEILNQSETGPGLHCIDVLELLDH
jgi:hypothetical protein